MCGFGVVGRAAVMVGHRVDERTGGVTYFCCPQVHEVARESRLRDIDASLRQARAECFLASDGFGGKEVTDHLMPGALCARERGC